MPAACPMSLRAPRSLVTSNVIFPHFPCHCNPPGAALSRLRRPGGYRKDLLFPSEIPEKHRRIKRESTEYCMQTNETSGNSALLRCIQHAVPCQIIQNMRLHPSGSSRMFTFSPDVSYRWAFFPPKRKCPHKSPPKPALTPRQSGTWRPAPHDGQRNTNYSPRCPGWWR